MKTWKILESCDLSFMTPDDVIEKIHDLYGDRVEPQQFRNRSKFTMLLFLKKKLISCKFHDTGIGVKFAAKLVSVRSIIFEKKDLHDFSRLRFE